MAQTITIPLGQSGIYGPINQVGADGTVLSPRNADYSAPTLTLDDPTVVSASLNAGNTYTLTGLKVGTTTGTASATSSTSGDISPITEVNTIIVTGPVASALHGAFALNS